RVEPVAGGVAGEDAPGAVATVRGGREPEDEQPRARIAEPGHGPAPVGLADERAPLHARDLLAVRDEARAEAALDDRALEGGERAAGGGGARRHGRESIAATLARRSA